GDNARDPLKAATIRKVPLGLLALGNSRLVFGDAIRSGLIDPGLRVDGQEPILERINRVRDRLLEELEPPGRFNVVQPARLATNGHGARISRKGRDADILRIEQEAPTTGGVNPHTVI